jgi:hypothetical protein
MCTAHFNIQSLCILRTRFTDGVLYGSHSKEANISLNNISQFVFKMEAQCVLCEVDKVLFFYVKTSMY